MDEIITQIFYLVMRYLHVVATALLLGGTLFYEMVVPVAIGDLKDEHQLSVFARARWVFRSIVYISVVLLLISGGVSSYRNWQGYHRDEQALEQAMAMQQPPEPMLNVLRPRFWWAFHTAIGLVSMGIAVMLVRGPRPPDRPIQWMRLNLVLLLVAVLLASATRNARLRLIESREEYDEPRVIILPAATDDAP